jgi:hypothetical protein
MEELKDLNALTLMDETHTLIGGATRRVPELRKRHSYVASITMHEGVPEAIRGQFNVARNMALYQYFMYSLAPEVQLKTYTIIEHALRLRNDPSKRTPFAALLEKAAAQGWIQDTGFRHLENASDENSYVRSLARVLPLLRKDAAHGSTQLTPDCIGHLEKCADLVNQLFDPGVRQSDG